MFSLTRGPLSGADHGDLLGRRDIVAHLKRPADLAEFDRPLKGGGLGGDVTTAHAVRSGREGGGRA
jgi:hypothetical protein